MQDFRRLEVWQLAHQLTLGVYRVTRRFPPEEKFGLTSQVRRSSSSIGANIAEGCGLRTDPAFRKALSEAMGSACETEYHLILASDLGLAPAEPLASLVLQCTRVQQMLSKLIKRLGP